MNYTFYFILLLFISCSFQPDQNERSGAYNNFADEMLRKIACWQDHRQTDSLLKIITSGSEYRAAAARAFGSVQDISAIPVLKGLLADQQKTVRMNAAFALGQMYDAAVAEILIKRLPVEGDPEVKASLLEALGKTVPESGLQELVQFIPKNNKETAGYAWGLYRAGIRGIFNGQSTDAIIQLLDTVSDTGARLAAAHYLARVKYQRVPSSGFAVINKPYPEAEVRMAIALAFNKTPRSVAYQGLRPLLNDPDYRVRANAVRAIPDQYINDYSLVMDTLLIDENVNTAIATAGKLVSSAEYLSEGILSDWLQASAINWRVRALLLQAAVKKDPGDDKRIEQVKRSFQSSSDPYEKAELLQALSHTLRAYQFLITETFRATHPAVSTSGISALAALRSKEDFPEALKPAFRDVFLMALESGDVAMMGIVADVLADSVPDFKNEIKDPEILTNAIAKLRLPKDNETLQALEKALAYFENRSTREVINDFNHPVNWEEVEKLEGRPEALIETSKGNFKISLFTNEAPGTVLNFLRLARSGYYNNKLFHRVVPNFVVQGGGNRGDGWGSENFSLRSEFSTLQFTTGAIGMASAGKDTEGIQWFITHSPTPHLEGRYTIFAQVEDGMDIVHQLEQGDIIYSVKIF